MKVGIVIICYNIDTRILILQLDAIKKYCTDEDYRIEIVDNSSIEEQAEAIKHYAKVYGLDYQRTKSSAQNDSWSHSFAANFSYERLKNDYDLFFYIDHDCIPLKKFSVKEILGDKIMAGVRSGPKLNYFWPGCLMWNNVEIDKSLVSFSPNNAMRLDTGGQLYRVIEKYGEDRCLFFDEVGCQNPYFLDTPLYTFYMMICNETFMHFINASGWNPTERNDQRLNSLINIATNKIAENG